MTARAKLIALFLLSMALIMYELFTMRVFSVGSWSNFGSLVISTALLGFGVAGTLLTFLRPRVERRPDLWMFASAAGFLPALAAAHVAGQMVPFNPIFIGSDDRQLLWIGAYYLVYGLPFFFGALFIGVSFIALEDKVRQLYFWNMLGSGLGGLLLIPLMALLPTAALILPILAIACLACLLAAVERDGSGPAYVPAGRMAFTAAAFLAATALVLAFGDIRVSEYKAESYVRKYPDAVQVHRSSNPVSEMSVYASSYFHFAPGLSDNAYIALGTVPQQPYWALFRDGNGPVGIMGRVREEEKGYMDFLPMAAPYALRERPRVLLVNLGGGISAQIARYKDASRITVVERDPETVKLLREDPMVSAFTGNLLKDPRIETIVGEPRAHCLKNRGAYDLVEIGLIDSIGLSDSGGYAVSENYTYTREAIRAYMGSLSPDGMLAITVWNRLNPPRNVPRILTTVVSALRELGVKDPGERLFLFDLFQSTATLLVKNGPFTEGQIYELRNFAAVRSFEVEYYPGMPKRDLDFSVIADAYNAHFSGGRKPADSPAFSVGDVYHLVLWKLLEGREEELYASYIFDIRPMTDDRPYYSGYLRFDRLPDYVDQIQDVSEEWGLLLILGILLQSVAFGLVVVLLPVAGRWKDLFRRRRGTGGVVVYYAALGLGYMIVEIFLMQKLVFFLSDPVYSSSIVITVMLIVSALGNLAAPHIAKSRAWAVRIAALGIVAMAVFYGLGLKPVFDRFLGEPMAVRILVSVAVIFPMAFFLGIPFPTGLSALTEKRPRLLPWAWGLNGGLSVTGTALAQVSAVAYGFPVLLVAAGALYLAAGAVYSCNEVADTGEAAPSTAPGARSTAPGA